MGAEEIGGECSVNAIKLRAKKHRCDGFWASVPNQRCTQISKYKIGKSYYCTTHAKIRALKELLDE